MSTFKNLATKALLASPLRHLYFYRYQYNFAPSQICFLCNTISSVASVEGAFLEIGCAYGATTVFLNKHMDNEGVEKKYICIDTFDGFTNEDIAFEVERRRKVRDMFAYGFKLNSKKRSNTTYTQTYH